VPAPRLRWSDEVGDWVVLGIDPVRGRMPGPTWSADDLTAAVRACEAAAAALDPAPVGMELTRLADDLDDGSAWRRWYDDVSAGRRTTSLLSPWARSALPDLHRMLQESGAAIAGDAACHGDLRPDNMVVDATGAVWICDWNWLSLGAAWTDLVGLLVIVHGDGGAAEAALRSTWLLDGVDADAVDAWLALLGAFMCAQAEDPPPSSVSTSLGRHRAYFGTSALSWLEARHSS
jgi:aminoglycoside phosphotransferase (APT) family kinase protein